MFSLIPWKKRNNGGSLAVSRDWQGDFPPLAPLLTEFESLWDRFCSDAGRDLSLWGSGFGSGMNSGLEDKENEYVFHAELPGFQPDEIDVRVEGNRVQVKAEHKEEKQGKQQYSYRYGSYQRSFSLPHGVDDQNVDARYRSGVLEVHLPKTERAKGKRIPVTVR